VSGANMFFQSSFAGEIATTAMNDETRIVLLFFEGDLGLATDEVAFVLMDGLDMDVEIAFLGEFLSATRVCAVEENLILRWASLDRQNAVFKLHVAS
jgi:hypothetical protein